jgi:hypothetical protein
MRYLNRPEAVRCIATIILADKSEAQCQRFKRADSPYCSQHTKLIYGAKLSQTTRADMYRR